MEEEGVGQNFQRIEGCRTIYVIYTTCKTDKPATIRRSRSANTRFTYLVAERAPLIRHYITAGRRLARL